MIWGKLGLGLLLFCAHCAQGQTSLEHISTEKISHLQLTFEQGHRFQGKELKKLNQTVWNCQLFGMKSRLMIVRNVEIFRFQFLGNNLKNQGNHEIQSFSWSDGDLQGKNQRIVETIRQVDRSHIISKVQKRGPSNDTIAFSLCQKSKSS